MPAAKQPNIVFFFWDNLGWGEVGCYGGGELRGAPTQLIRGGLPLGPCPGSGGR